MHITEVTRASKTVNYTKKIRQIARGHLAPQSASAWRHSSTTSPQTCAILALTKRFSAEIAIRPFLLRYTTDPNRMCADWSA